jgi:hypothetical protein
MVKIFEEYIMNSLDRSEWLNYGEETDIANKADDSEKLDDTNIKKTARVLTDILGGDTNGMLVTSEEIGTGSDYEFFSSIIVPRSNQEDIKVLDMSDFAQYFKVYTFNGAKFVLVIAKGMGFSSYIVILESDFDTYSRALGNKPNDNTVV